jgi:hypothetical protein
MLDRRSYGVPGAVPPAEELTSAAASECSHETARELRTEPRLFAAIHYRIGDVNGTVRSSRNSGVSPTLLAVIFTRGPWLDNADLDRSFSDTVSTQAGSHTL